MKIKLIVRNCFIKKILINKVSSLMSNTTVWPSVSQGFEQHYFCDQSHEYLSAPPPSDKTLKMGKKLNQLERRRVSRKIIYGNYNSSRKFTLTSQNHN